MEEELEGIVQNMINAGESEENIALVIKSYKSEPVKKKDGTKPVSTSTTKVEKSVSIPTDGSLDFAKTPKSPTESILEANTQLLDSQKKPVEKSFQEQVKTPNAFLSTNLAST